MKADYEHYKLHWEFFKSVNPKADERFFVELQINDTDKQIKQGLKEIDFANDSTNTIEGYTNNSKRMDFFFHKEYNEFLKAKLVELKAKENLKVLPPLKNSIIVHYGCSDFNSNEHKVYWIGAINHTPNKTYFFENRNEVEVIEKFYKYVQDNKEKTFIHWSMNSPKFGFRAIENRYFELTNIEIDLKPKYEIDLSEYLKNKYGINYIERQNGRLNNLAKLNGFSGIQSDVEVINMNDATNRLELIFSIVQAEIQGNLKTNTELSPQPIKTKADILKEQLSQYGFFELEKVKTLSEQSKVSIIEKIAESGLPYAIAMFDYLEFIPYLEKKHFDRKYKLNKEVSKWFDSDQEGRAVKGNINSLLKNSTENKDRYTAYKHKENVIKDYKLLK